jgi:hypothetical protein
VGGRVNSPRGIVENQDLVAASWVVGKDPAECDYLDVQEAYDNLVDDGGEIFVLPGRYALAATIAIGDKPVSIQGSGPSSTIFDLLSNAIPAFTIANVQTFDKVDLFRNFSVAGDGVTPGQTAFAYADTTSHVRLEIEQVHEEGTIESVLDLQAYDTTFARELRIRFTKCQFISSGLAGSSLAKDVNPAGTYASAKSVQFLECLLGDFFNFFDWTLQVDGDVVIEGPEENAILFLSAGSAVNGFRASEFFLLIAEATGGDFTVFGSGLTTQSWVRNVTVSSFTQISRLVWKSSLGVLEDLSVIAVTVRLDTVNDVVVLGSTFSGGGFSATLLDVQASQYLRVSACHFSGATTQAILINNTVQSTIQANFVGQTFATVVETGSSDFTLIHDSPGIGGTIGGGLGPTLIGASSRIDPENFRNVIDFGADPTGVADSAAAIQRAINALPTAGGIVFFPPGTYKIAGALTLPSKGVILRGSGRGVTVVDASGGNFAAFQSAFSVQYEFEDLNVLGSGAIGSQFFTATAGSAAQPSILGTRVDLSNVEIGIYGPTGTSPQVTLYTCTWKVADLATSFHFKTDDNQVSFLTAKDCTWTSLGGGQRGGFKGQWNVTLSNCIMNLLNGGEFSFAVCDNGCEFQFGPVQLLSNNESKIDDCFFFTPAGGQLRWLDIAAPVSRFSISNCVFDDIGGANELVRVATTDGKILGCQFFASAAEVTIREIGAADRNQIDDCGGLNSGAGMVLVGQSTMVNGALQAAATDQLTVDAYVIVTGFPQTNPRGLLGIGTLKNLSATFAAGTITTIVAANIVNGETFTLNDGTNPAKIFEFRHSGAVTPGHVLVDISVAVTADDVRDAIITAVNGVGAGLAITASNGGSATVDLVNDATGSAGNQAITDTVADAGFTHTGMSGGTDANAINVQETVTDAFGTTDNTTVTSVPAGATYMLDIQTNFGAAFPPHVSYTVEVQSAVAGHPAAYSLRFVGQGAVL